MEVASSSFSSFLRRRFSSPTTLLWKNGFVCLLSRAYSTSCIRKKSVSSGFNEKSTSPPLPSLSLPHHTNSTSTTMSYRLEYASQSNTLFSSLYTSSHPPYRARRQVASHPSLRTTTELARFLPIFAPRRPLHPFYRALLVLLVLSHHASSLSTACPSPLVPLPLPRLAFYALPDRTRHFQVQGTYALQGH